MLFVAATARHLAVQLAAFGIGWFWWSPILDTVSFVTVQAIAVLMIVSYMKLSLPVRVAHLLFVPVVALAVWFDLPAWLYLLGFVLLFAISRNAVFERVPLYFSSKSAATALAGILPEDGRLLDLGCGNGRLLLIAAKARPDVEFVGIENAVLPWLAAVISWLSAGRPANVKIRYGSMWAIDWLGYDAIYAFLSPAPMARVWASFQAATPPGTMLISNSFAIEGVEPDEVLPLDGHLQKALLIWRKK